MGLAEGRQDIVDLLNVVCEAASRFDQRTQAGALREISWLMSQNGKSLREVCTSLSDGTRFRELQYTKDENRTIDSARSLLERHFRCKEQEAYHLLRVSAMDYRLGLPVIAEIVLSRHVEPIHRQALFEHMDALRRGQ